MNTDKPVSALTSTIHLGLGLSISGYLLPSGEFAYALDYLSQLMGHANNYYRRLFSTDLSCTKKIPKKLRLFLDKGFKPYKIAIRDKSRGTAPIDAIKFDAFCLIVETEAQQGNLQAIALLSSAFRELLRSRTQEAFDLPQDSLEKRVEAFQLNYDHYLEDKQDTEGLALPGDEIGGYELVTEWDVLFIGLERDYPEIFLPGFDLHLNYEG